VKFKIALFASACAFALAAPASAQFAGQVGAGYSHINADHININDLNASLAAESALFDTDFHLQANMTYSNLAVHDAPVTGNEWSGGGTAFWATDMFRAGVTANDDTIHFGPRESSEHETSFGGFGEWFCGAFTAGLKAGDISGSGAYVGGEGAFYAMPNLALTGTIDYSGASHTHETDFTPQVEYLFSDEIPVSLYAGYTYASASGFGSSGNGNAFFVGLHLYVNSNGATGLIGRQRTGTVGWGSTFGPLGANL
jgi:hypothetical protein